MQGGEVKFCVKLIEFIWITLQSIKVQCGSSQYCNTVRYYMEFLPYCVKWAVLSDIVTCKSDLMAR